MDLKGTLVDTKIKIYPSQILINFLESLPLENGMPEKIRNYTKDTKSNHKTTEIEKIKIKKNNSAEVHFNNEDLENIKKIKEILTKKKKNSEDLDSENFDPTNNKDEGNNNKYSKEKKNDKNKLETDTESGHHNNDKLCLGISDIDWLYSHLNNERRDNKNIPYLHELLEGTQIEMPENVTIKRNPDLEARCVKLRAQQEAREYRKMTKGVDNVRIKYPEDSISFQLKQMNRQMIVIGQFLLSIFAGFLFGFRGVELIIGNLDFGFRLLLGVMCALIIALAEIYFIAKKLNEELSVPETVQIGGPPKFEDDNHEHYTKKVDSKEHID